SVRLCSPHFDFLGYMRPRAQKIFKARWSPRRLAREAETQLTDLIASLKSVPVNVGEVFSRVAEGRLRIESYNPDVARVEKKLELLATKVPLAIVVSAVILGSVALLCVPGADPGSLRQILALTGLGGSALIIARLFLR
ncbi:MAG: hypothetical protein AAF488_11005, partial [Planctomycetota bacterium]